MKRILPPNTYTGARESLYLAGGITLWRDQIIKKLSQLPIIIYDPVVENYTPATHVKWERAHMLKATAVLFWFPQEAVCPISLYELGAVAATNKPLIVGTHPFYKYKEDVKIQLAYARPDVYVVHMFEDLVKQIKERFNGTNTRRNSGR